MSLFIASSIVDISNSALCCTNKNNDVAGIIQWNGKCMYQLMDTENYALNTAMQTEIVRTTKIIIDANEQRQPTTELHQQ